MAIQYNHDYTINLTTTGKPEEVIAHHDEVLAKIYINQIEQQD